MTTDVTLEQALDAILEAAAYAEREGHNDICAVLNEQYQALSGAEMDSAQDQRGAQ
jgi:hypothetical protein